MACEWLRNFYRMCLDITLPLVVIASMMIGNHRALHIVSENAGWFIFVLQIHFYLTIFVWFMAGVSAFLHVNKLRDYIGNDAFEAIGKFFVLVASDGLATLFWILLVLGFFQGEFFVLLTPIITLESSAIFALMFFVGNLETVGY